MNMKTHIHNNLQLLKLLSLGFLLSTLLPTSVYMMDYYEEWDRSSVSFSGVSNVSASQFFVPSQESSRAGSPRLDVHVEQDAHAEAVEPAALPDEDEVECPLAQRELIFIEYKPGEDGGDGSGDDDDDGAMDAGPVDRGTAPACARKRFIEDSDEDYEESLEEHEDSDDSDEEKLVIKPPRKRRRAADQEEREVPMPRLQGQHFTEEEYEDLTASLRQHLHNTNSTGFLPPEVWQGHCDESTVSRIRKKLGLSKADITERKKVEIKRHIQKLHDGEEVIDTEEIRKQFRCAPGLVVQCRAELGLSEKASTKVRLQEQREAARPFLRMVLATDPGIGHKRFLDIHPNLEMQPREFNSLKKELLARQCAADEVPQGAAEAAESVGAPVQQQQRKLTPREKDNIIKPILRAALRKNPELKDVAFNSLLEKSGIEGLGHVKFNRLKKEVLEDL